MSPTTHTGAPTRVHPIPPEPDRPRRRWLLALGVGGAGLLVVGGAVAVVGWSPAFAVRSLDITGATPPVAGVGVDEAAVRAAVGAVDGTPLVRLDVDAIAARVRALPGVADVVVQRGWPATLGVVVTPRVPVAAQRADSGYDLVDVEGVVLAQRPGRGSGDARLPLLDHARGEARIAALQVAAAVPPSLRARIDLISATGPQAVVVRLRRQGGVAPVVRWGSAERSADKATVLTALLAQPDARSISRYDVSAPDLPTRGG